MTFIKFFRYRAGYKLTVIDASDKDWWRGSYFGAVGVFPSTYVTKLGPREKPLQVIQSVNINSIHGDGLISLLRDQVNVFFSNNTFFPSNQMMQIPDCNPSQRRCVQRRSSLDSNFRTPTGTLSSSVLTRSMNLQHIIPKIR